MHTFTCAFTHTGDVEIGLMERNGGLEVEVVQARGLTMKPGSKGPPGEFCPIIRTMAVFLHDVESLNIIFELGLFYIKKAALSENVEVPTAHERTTRQQAAAVKHVQDSLQWTL